MVSTSAWENCLGEMEEIISSQHFNTWFKPINFINEVNGEIQLEVPNRFFLDWIKEHYLNLIQEVIKKSTTEDFKISWIVSDEETLAKATKRAPRAKKVSTKTTKRAQTHADHGLCSRYTFDNFVVGKANEFAHAACYATAKNPAGKYNPLFIYGGVGLGKTHLLHSIGLEFIKNNPGQKVCYYTSEKFMNEFINFVSRHKMNEFRKKFRNVDLLLIDDIQFWAGKERTQEEFFHTFNTLYEGHKQIVVTCDKFPKDIDGLEERLRSRFEWGLVADIQPPDMETKIAILMKKAKEYDIEIPGDALEWLATVSKSNIRELEGYLNRVFAVSSLTAQEITLPMCKEALKNITKDAADTVLSIESIQKAVCSHYNVKIADLRSKRRHRVIALPRQVAMYLARTYGNFSYPEIGSSFGGKDHTTAIHAVRKIEKSLDNDPDTTRNVRVLKNALSLD